MGTNAAGEQTFFGVPTAGDFRSNASKMIADKMAAAGLPPDLINRKSQKMGGAGTPDNYGLPSLAGVPKAAGDFFKPVDDATRSQLIQTMMDKARGRTPSGAGGAGSPNGGVVIR